MIDFGPKLNKRPAMQGAFRVLVVPTKDSPSVNNNHNSRMISDHARIAAMSGNNIVEASFWAFTPTQRKQVVSNLRALANFLEKGA